MGCNLSHHLDYIETLPSQTFNQIIEINVYNSNSDLKEQALATVLIYISLIDITFVECMTLANEHLPLTAEQQPEENINSFKKCFMSLSSHCLHKSCFRRFMVYIFILLTKENGLKFLNNLENDNCIIPSSNTKLILQNVFLGLKQIDSKTGVDLMFETNTFGRFLDLVQKYARKPFPLLFQCHNVFNIYFFFK